MTPDPGHRGYLAGHCHLRREVRTFAVERIRAVETLREAFAMPADFDAEAYLRGRGASCGET